MKKQARKKPIIKDLRGEILLASQKIVLAEGFPALSMRRVAKAIGYSATTLYLYFINRDAIVAELGRRALDQLIEGLGATDPQLPPRERLQRYGSAYLRFSAKHPDSYRLIFMENADLADAIFRSRDGRDASDAGAQALAYFVQAFAELKIQEPAARGGLEPAQAAEIYWATLHGIASLKITCGKFLRTDAEELLQRAIPALLGGM